MVKLGLGFEFGKDLQMCQKCFYFMLQKYFILIGSVNWSTGTKKTVSCFHRLLFAFLEMSKCCQAAWQAAHCSPRQQSGNAALPHDNHNHKPWSWERPSEKCLVRLWVRARKRPYRPPHLETRWLQCGSEERKLAPRFKGFANYWSVNTSQCEIGRRSRRSYDVHSFWVIKKGGGEDCMSKELDAEGAIIVLRRLSKGSRGHFLFFVNLYFSGWLEI